MWCGIGISVLSLVLIVYCSIIMYETPKLSKKEKLDDDMPSLYSYLVIFFLVFLLNIAVIKQIYTTVHVDISGVVAYHR